MFDSILLATVYFFIGIFNATAATSKYVRGGKWLWRFGLCTGGLPAVLMASVWSWYFAAIVSVLILYLLLNPWA